MAQIPKNYRSVDSLLEIMKQLRDPENGCPWDVEQTFDTIAPYTIEEAYEVADVIARKDLDALPGELGDLLLQVVFHARMAEEEGRFSFADVVEAVCEKMIRRHPHVFGDGSANTPDAVKGTWESIKDAERKEKHDGGTPSVLDDVPVALPALTRAEKLQKRAARVGFDWPDTKQVLNKLNEEMAELSEALTDSEDKAAIFEEFGDLLFVYANLARHLDVDPEAALRATNEKFIRRFHRIEEILRDKGRTPQDSSLEEMDALWDQTKAEEKGLDGPPPRTLIRPGG